MEKIWYNKIAIIVNKINMVSLDLFATVDLYFGKAKALHKNSSAVLGGLSVVIFLGNFFQFSSLIERFLWEVSLSLHEKHRQYIWHHFTNVIILTEQIRQQGDIVFQQLSKRARPRDLTKKNVNLLNNKIAKKLPTSNDLSLVVIVQFNTKKYLINCYQIYKFAKEKFQDVYIFSASHIRSKTSNKNLVTSKKLF